MYICILCEHEFTNETAEYDSGMCPECGGDLIGAEPNYPDYDDMWEPQP